LNSFEHSSNYNYAQQDNDSGLSIGQRVFHQKFGEGFVLNYEGQGKSAAMNITTCLNPFMLKFSLK